MTEANDNNLDSEEDIVEQRYKGRLRAGDQITTLMVDRLIGLYEKDMRYRKFRVVFLSAFMFLGAVYYISFDKIWNPANFVGDYAALVRLQGEIGANSKVSALKVNPALARAFKDKDAKGVILLINSPGGSPVQSALIRDRIMQLRQEYPEKKVVVIGEDVVASGGYFIATGADTIYVNRSSLIGSIGVRMDSFGFDLSKYAHKFGIEYRTITEGKWKNRLDMFQPLKDEDVSWARRNLKITHQHFIDAVLETREKKLNGSHDYLFSGELWSGEESLDLGLVDGLSDLHTVLKTEYAVDAIRDYTPTPSFFNKLQESYGVFNNIFNIFNGSVATVKRY